MILRVKHSLLNLIALLNGHGFLSNLLPNLCFFIVVVVLVVTAGFFSNSSSENIKISDLNSELVLHYTFSNVSTYENGKRMLIDFSGKNNHGVALGASHNSS